MDTEGIRELGFSTFESRIRNTAALRLGTDVARAVGNASRRIRVRSGLSETPDRWLAGLALGRCNPLWISVRSTETNEATSVAIESSSSRASKLGIEVRKF